MQTKRILWCAHFLIFLLIASVTTSSFAQFKKYRSQTEFSDAPEEDNIDQDLDDIGIDELPPEVLEDLEAQRGAQDNQPDEIRPAPPTPPSQARRRPTPTPRPTARRAPRARPTPPSRPAPGRRARTSPGNDSQKDNFFGRNEQTTTTVKTKDSKYVNLNPETAFGPEIITSFDFPNTDIMEITKHMQKLTGINLILDKDVRGKISIIAPSAITVGDAWKAYLTALDMNGYTIIKDGAFYKIINQREIRNTPTQIYTGSYTPDTAAYMMRVYPLKHINAIEITRNFRPFMSRYGRLIDIKQTNTLIMIDTGNNINRLVQLIKYLDVPGHDEQLQIIKVKHSSAQEIAKLLDSILKSRGSSASRRRFPRRGGSGEVSEDISKIIAEPRTNSIIAMANAEGGKHLRTLINKLDVPLVDQAGGRIHVYYLNHSDAEGLAKTLSSLVSGAGAKSSGARSSRFARNESSLADLFTAQVKITADKDNNALVITASPTDYLTVRDVISKLDVPRDQVFIEGLIMETNVNKVDAKGVSIMGAYGSGNAARAGFDGTGQIVDLLGQNFTNLNGLFAGIGAGKKVDLNIGDQEITVNTINGLITAIATKGNTNVLATPQLLVMDNKEGAFEVGETVPVPERTNAANGSSTVSIREQKVTLSLKITPQINKVTRFIKLKIDQKIDDFSNRELGGIEGFGTTTRAAQTTVMVRDRDTIAMGGLMRDKEIDTVNKVPLLGDIPVLGWLFKSTRKSTEKINLLFFLTPKILMTYEKTAAKTTKDILNRRSAHLKNVLGEDDPFAATVKGVYEKVKRQQQGALYDRQDANNRFQQNNTDLQIIEEVEGPEKLEEEENDVVPNYQEILKQVEEKQET